MQHKTWISKWCEACGKIFKVMPCRREAKFCSIPCGNLIKNRRTQEIICLNCGKVAQRAGHDKRGGRNRQFCSKKCRVEYRKLHPKFYKTYIKMCPICGNSFERLCNETTYCSHKCWAKTIQTNLNRRVNCAVCGKEFTPTSRNVLCCSLVCSIVKRTQTAAAMRIEKVCIVCGKIYYVDGHHTFSKTCSKACADLIHSRLRRIHLLDGNEEFADWEIFERDNWICQICHKPVKRGVNGKNPLQPSLDHIVPLSLGGLHIRQNVRCTHLKCNLRRSNRGVAQLLLTG